MPNSIKIKRSLVAASPATLSEGELAYSEVSGNLFIGKSGGNIDIIGGNLSNPTHTAAIQTIVGAMVSGNTESGINITYDATGKKINFDVNDPTISITGDATGSATMTNLGNTSIGVTLANANSNVGTYGGADTIPVITVNAKGQVTSVGTASISVSNNPTLIGATINGNLTITGTVDGVDVSSLSSTVNTHIGAGADSHAIATTSLNGFLSSADKTKLDALYTWYSNMTTADGNTIINTLNEMLAAFSSAPEGLNIYTELTTPTNMILDGGTF